MAAPRAGETSETLLLNNGIEAVIYGPEDLLAMITRDEGGLSQLLLPDGSVYRLIEDVSDPLITNKGDGAFHPMDVLLVGDALGAIGVRGARLDLPLVVYVLPMPRATCIASSESGGALFLSPGVCERGVAEIARIVAHECAHAFQERYLPLGSTAGWDTYLALRGLDGDPRFREEAGHEWRPSEIFAEDFRFLFGGENARMDGTIENCALPLPSEVDGLEEFFCALVDSPAQIAAGQAQGLLTLMSYPNPFNPVTTIRMMAAEADRGGMRISIHRIDGSLVRELAPVRVASDAVEAVWDGRDASGAPLPSGVYFCRGSWSGASAMGKLVLLR